jgi:hypothetical protein
MWAYYALSLSYLIDIIISNYVINNMYVLISYMQIKNET